MPLGSLELRPGGLLRTLRHILDMRSATPVTVIRTHGISVACHWLTVATAIAFTKTKAIFMLITASILLVCSLALKFRVSLIQPMLEVVEVLGLFQELRGLECRKRRIPHSLTFVQ